MSCRVTILQTNIKWADPDANQKALESALFIFSSEKSDLYVLPEMWNTGFLAGEESKDSLIHNSKFIIQNLKELARRFDAAIAGSMDVEEDGKRYNRFYFVTPTDVYTYDKRHLFSYAGEDKNFAAGDERTIVEWRGVKFLLQVCYDLRFPCFSRNSLIADGTPLYDAIIYVANWPASRRRVWDVLLQARALENQCFVIGVNRVGDDPNCHYDGGSAIIDAKGKILAKVQDETAASATALLDMESLNAFRAKFPVLRDADK
jgi:predicted amidohydrolase